jgi:hypothetical protein
MRFRGSEIGSSVLSERLESARRDRRSRLAGDLLSFGGAALLMLSLGLVMVFSFSWVVGW